VLRHLLQDVTLLDRGGQILSPKPPWFRPVIGCRECAVIVYARH
jgi:hypothetical protein